MLGALFVHIENIKFHNTFAFTVGHICPWDAQGRLTNKTNNILWISIANFSAIVKQLVIHKQSLELARDVVPAHRIMTVLTPSAREAYNVTFTC